MGQNGRGSKAPGKPARRGQPISKADLAARKGVTRSAVTKACLPGGPLAEALLETNRIDLSHPAAEAWLASGAGSIDALGAAPTGAPKADDVAKLGELTLNEIVERHGTVQGFIDYVDALKKIAETHRLALKNAEVEGSLISRELVRTHVFGAIDAVNRRLLTDSVKTIVGRAYAMTKAGETAEEIQRVAAELMSATLAPAKTAAARAL